MSQDDDPLISIITVNFNGRPFLKNLFDSVASLSYPAEKIQMIMVDNNSTDGSVEFTRKEFPWVEVVTLGENRGYAGGNNEGFRHSKGRYITLINNDCIVERDWLAEMLSIFKQSTKDSKIGAVGSRVVFYYSYLPLQLIAGSIRQKESGNNGKLKRLGAGISDLSVSHGGRDEGYDEGINKSVKYMDGFHPAESDRKGDVWRWTKGDAILAIPAANPDRDIEIKFKVRSRISPNNLQFVLGDEILRDIKISEKVKTVKIKIPKNLFFHCRDIINSCGVKVNNLFYSMDRGFESIDEGQYDRVEEIFGASGSSCMLDRRMIEETGFFDDSFFTYYEDIDLFWRARLAGWKNFFTPKSVARHFHCGTDKEWSYNFTYHVIRNRLLMIFKCGWPLLFIKCYLAFVVSGLIHILYYLFNLLRGDRHKRIDIPVRIRVFFEFFYLLPKNMVRRIKIRAGRKGKDKIIKSWMRSF
ncbi:MAG: glycosyltransferase family 2 protein [Actinomycetota bacterium]|nr:glycosyltransferase family 2 protein [Actinomycetota bacterium]